MPVITMTTSRTYAGLWLQAGVSYDLDTSPASALVTAGSATYGAPTNSAIQQLVYVGATGQLQRAGSSALLVSGAPFARRTLVVDGDSQSKNGDVVSAGAYRLLSSRGYWVHCLAEIGWPYDVVAVSAVPGETMQQILARFDSSVAAYRPNEVLLMPGQNNSLDTDDCVAFGIALREYAMKCRAIGAALRIVYTTPRYGAFSTTTVRQNIVLIRQYIAELVRNNLAVASDAHRALIDRTSSVGSALSGMLYDQASAGVHIGAKGGVRIGRQFAKDFARENFSNPFVPPASNVDCRQTYALSKQLMLNPLLSGSAGTVTAPAAGVAPDSWQIQYVRSGTSAALVTMATNVADASDPGGTACTLTFSGTKTDGADDIAILNASAQFANMASGAALTPGVDYIDYARMAIKATNVSSNFSYAKLQIEALNGSTPLYESTCMAESASDPQGEFSPNELVFHAPGFVIPVGTTRIRANLKIGYGAGACTGVFTVPYLYCRIK